jgi:hypothetical protein
VQSQHWISQRRPAALATLSAFSRAREEAVIRWRRGSWPGASAATGMLLIDSAIARTGVFERVNSLSLYSHAREGDPSASGFDPGGGGRQVRGSFGARRSKPLAEGWHSGVCSLSICRKKFRPATLPFLEWMAVPAVFVVAAKSRSVPTAVSGWTPKSSISNGVIREPPPIPVRPTRAPTTKPQSG